MEGGHACLRDVVHPVKGLAADVQDQRTGESLGHLLVDLEQEPPVVLAADKVASGVVRECERIGSRCYLGFPEEDRDLLETMKASQRHVGVIDSHEQESLNPKDVIG